MPKELGKLFLVLFILVISIIVGITIVIGVISILSGSEIHIESWSGPLLLAVGTFLWIFPLQVIEWLRFIPVQRRIRRMIYPYFITLFQVVLFVFYIIGLNMMLPTIELTDRGLVLYVFIIVIAAKIAFSFLIKQEREIAKERNMKS
ncbi:MULTISPECIES: hypothetical protein [Bacillaceae]|uniref:Uncharacterized protein n=1 Tax=Evansella alkalicola TaxID=745819 RepID=A0ABS6JW75_9BACI|nr:MULTISPECIES: hypothetical protein [Bacillaceae]MBU9722843.1 hypothetical protein [Bacillus alkalicola]